MTNTPTTSDLRALKLTEEEWHALMHMGELEPNRAHLDMLVLAGLAVRTSIHPPEWDLTEAGHEACNAIDFVLDWDDLILTVRTWLIVVLTWTGMGGSRIGFGGVDDGQTRVNEFGSILLGNEGGVAYWPTSTVNRGDGLNFHESKILTMRRSGVDLVKYVGTVLSW